MNLNSSTAAGVALGVTGGMEDSAPWMEKAHAHPNPTSTFKLVGQHLIILLRAKLLYAPRLASIGAFLCSPFLLVFTPFLLSFHSIVGRKSQIYQEQTSSGPRITPRFGVGGSEGPKRTLCECLSLPDRDFSGALVVNSDHAPPSDRRFDAVGLSATLEIVHACQ